jgi:hypothetical protein
VIVSEIGSTGGGGGSVALPVARVI